MAAADDSTPTSPNWVDESGERVLIDSTSAFSSDDLYHRTKQGRTPETRDGDSADEVDPTKLFRDISVNQIRWYYRNDGLASTIVDKPIEDAFKHGWHVENDPTDSVDSLLDRVDFEQEYKIAQKKARRDGFAVLLIVTSDTSEWHDPPSDANNFGRVERIRPLSIENFQDTTPSTIEDKLPEGYTRQDVEIRDSGLVISINLDDTERFGKPLGIIYDPFDERDHKNHEPTFIHWERFLIYPWRETVDGDTNDDSLGRYEGDSILQPVMNLLKSLNKGNWASMQALFRHSSPLHVLNPPEGVGEDEWDEANGQMENINSKSSFTMPPGGDGEWEMKAVNSNVAVDPGPHFAAIFDQICGGTEMTKSVLFGTQSGTVSGSETDIKNYYNQVDRMRTGRIQDDVHEFVRRVNTWDKSTIPNLSLGFTIDWEPLFRIERLDQTEAMARNVQALTNAIGRYLLEPDEARSILEQQWAEIDIDAELGDHDEDALDYLDRVNVQRGKQVADSTHVEESEMDPDMGGNPAVGQNGGGNEGLEDESDPTT